MYVLLLALQGAHAAFCQRNGKAALTCEGEGATKKCWPSEACARKLDVKEKARTCVEEHCGTGERPGLKAWGPMCLERCRAQLWRATSRQLVAPIIDEATRSPLVAWKGDLWRPNEAPDLPPSALLNASQFVRQMRRAAFDEALDKNYAATMGPRRGGGWFERGAQATYAATGGPLVLYGLQRSGTNALTGLISAHLGTEVYNGERADEYFQRRAPRLSSTRFNDPRWKHFRPTHVARLNASHVLYASPHSTRPHLARKGLTWREERKGVGGASAPANVEDDKEAFYARNVADLDALIRAEACWRGGALCSSVQVRAYVVGVRHPGAWLDSLHRHCPDCPLAMRGTRAKAVWHAPAYYARLWDTTMTRWLEVASSTPRVAFVRNEDVTRSCANAVRALGLRLGLRYDAADSARACSTIDRAQRVAMDLSGSNRAETKEELERGAGWLFGLSGSREALEALLAIDAQTMAALGYPKRPYTAFARAALELTQPMYAWFLESWTKVTKDKSGEAVSPTCDNLKASVQINRRAWWLKEPYRSTHPKTREDFLSLKHASDYVAPLRLDREKTSRTRHVALAALVRDACAAFTCNVHMVDALVAAGGKAQLDFRVYILEDGSSDCTPRVLQRWAAAHPYVHAVPPPSKADFAWDESTKGAYALQRDEALRQKRYERMALLRNHLTNFILKQEWFVDIVVVYDADQGSGWAEHNIVRALASVLDGAYDAICANGIIGQAQSDRFIHRDLLALRFSDFEDQPSGGIELAPGASPVSSEGRRFDAGARRVASCFGGLTIYDAAIFREDGCAYDYGVSETKVWDCEHVLLNRCLAHSGRALTLLPNLIINGPYATGRRAKIVHLNKRAPHGSHHKHEF